MYIKYTLYIFAYIDTRKHTEHHNPKTMKAAIVRMFPADKAVFEAIQEKNGFASQADAVAYYLKNSLGGVSESVATQVNEAIEASGFTRTSFVEAALSTYAARVLAAMDKDADTDATGRPAAFKADGKLSDWAAKFTKQPETRDYILTQSLVSKMGYDKNGNAIVNDKATVSRPAVKRWFAAEGDNIVAKQCEAHGVENATRKISVHNAAVTRGNA